MESFGRRLSKLRERTGLTRENMAKLLDMDVSGINCLENGYSDPDVKILLRLAQIFNVSAAYIAMLTEDEKCSEDSFVKEIYVAGRLRCGDGGITKKDVVGTTYINREEMHGKDYFGLVVKDDSMAKSRIFKDDVVIVRRQNYAANGDVIVCMVDNEREIVRRYQQSGNIVVLSADGNAANSVVKIDVSETTFIILGKVCEVRIKNI